MWQVIGQTRTVSFLQHSLDTGMMTHAYLLVGPAHVGKMTVALDLAGALNCESAERPCQQCASCLKIQAGNHADVRVIDLTMNEDETEATRIKVDQVEELQHDASLPPFEGRHKVFIINDADQMSTGAGNRLLKTLEEPTDRVTFILLTANEKGMLPTVVSRCQRLELRPLPPGEIAAALVERYGLEPAKAGLLAAVSHGCPGWAIAAAADESLLQQRREGLNRLPAVIAAGQEERFTLAAELATRFGRSRTAIYSLLDTWLDYWRDLMLVKWGCCDIITNIDRKDELIGIAAGYTGEQITACIDSIITAAGQLRSNANARLALEVLMLDIPGKEGSGDIKATRVRHG